MDTIFALATARGRAGIAVIRLSGPAAFDAVAALNVKLPPPRQAALRRLYDGDLLLDEALVLLFEEGASFTGEQVAELHVHGSIAVTTAVLDALSRQTGSRLAEAGEFTRRALDNGCLDLTQVEGLADLIDAETEAQRKQALRVLSGAIGRKADEWRRKLIRAAALIEATIDFVDEDVPVDVTPEVTKLIAEVKSDLKSEIDGSFAAERIRDGYEIAIIGAPNAGKSTLLNRLAKRDAAITSDVAGTTRDVIEVRMTLGGLSVTLLDTAGLRESDDPIEKIGITRAIERAEQADLRVFLNDGQKLPLQPLEGDIMLIAKVDTESENGISGKTGAGVQRLLDMICHKLQASSSAAGTITHLRHRRALSSALNALEIDFSTLGQVPAEIQALAVRDATLALDALIGRVNVENLLDEIFLSFCIGK